MAKKRSNKKSSPHHSTSPTAQRLNKVLAAAGLGSRRKVEDLIEQGRVEIDGDIVTDFACKVEPTTAKIKVDGELLKKSRPVYFALNKPPGVLSTNYDPSGRMRVIDLVPDRDRVFSVGRLDQSSEGLMLLTNDGELAQRLAHPKFRIQKTYFVVVSGQMSEDELTKLRKGVHLAEGMARIDGATIKRVRKGCTELEIVLSEGKNREIRRILARAGHKVVLLRRIAIGPLRLGQLPVGASRNLTSTELKGLYAATDPVQRTKKKPSQGSGKVASPTTSKKPTPTQEDDEDDDDLLSLAMAGGEADDDFSDDDFVGSFQGSGGEGRVLAFDEDGSAKPSAARPSRGRKPAAAGRVNQRESSEGSRTSPYAKASAKARAGKSKDGPRGARDSKPRASKSASSKSRTSKIGGSRTGRATGGAGKKAGSQSRSGSARKSNPRGKR